MWQSFSPIYSSLIQLTIVGLIGVLIAYFKYRVVKKDVYRKKTSVMTEAEQKYFKQLVQEYGEQYYIFPQINMDKLVTAEGANWYASRNKISRKSVDFVLADKVTLATQLVVELDDWTHNLKKRQERDAFVERVFAECGIGLKRTDLIE